MREEEHEPVEIDPEDLFDDPLEPEPEFGDQDEDAQLEEWEEDAREGGAI